MSLYLCVFEDDEELDGVDVGAYSDFGDFRKAVIRELECGKAGSRFPTLIRHSDCDGEWNLDDCSKLESELEIVSAELKQRPPRDFFADWQKNSTYIRRLSMTASLTLTVNRYWNGCSVW